MAAPGASAENADLAIPVGQGQEEARRPLQVADRLVIGDAACRARLGGHIFGRAVIGPVIQIWAERGVSHPRKTERGFLVPLVSAGHMMNQHHAGERPGPQRAGKIGVDDLPVVAGQADGFGQQTFICIRLVHGSSWVLQTIYFFSAT